MGRQYIRQYSSSMVHQSAVGKPERSTSAAAPHTPVHTTARTAQSAVGAGGSLAPAQRLLLSRLQPFQVLPPVLRRQALHLQGSGLDNGKLSRRQAASVAVAAGPEGTGGRRHSRRWRRRTLSCCACGCSTPQAGRTCSSSDQPPSSRGWAPTGGDCAALAAKSERPGLVRTPIWTA